MRSKFKFELHHFVFLMFILIHSVTCISTTYFGDDFYYAGFVRNGVNYFFSENLLHYKITNGRAFVHLLDELLLGFGLWPWRIFNIIVVALITVIIAKLASHDYSPSINSQKEEYRTSLIAACALISVFDLTILKQAFYFATGSMNYLFPAAATLLLYLLFRKDYEQGSSRKSFLLIIPSLIASITTEQASALAVLVVLCFIITKIVIKRERPHASYWICLITSFAAASTVFFAPGNSVRSGYYPDFFELSLIDKFKYNFESFVTVSVGSNGMCSTILFGFSVLSVLLLRKLFNNLFTKQSKWNFKKAINCLFITLALLLTITSGIVYFYWVTNPDKILLTNTQTILIFLPVMIGVLAYSVVLWIKSGDPDDMFFLFGSVTLQFVMIFSPHYGGRTIAISAILLAIPIVRRIAQLRKNIYGIILYLFLLLITYYLIPDYLISYNFIKIIFIIFTVIGTLLIIFKRKKHFLKYLPAVLFSALCLSQFSTVAYGYYDNLEVHRLNQEIIYNYDGNGTLTLYKLNNSTYSYVMTYQESNRYHEIKMLQLAGLPENTVVEYIDMPQSG